jgi:hypothetical protein
VSAPRTGGLAAALRAVARHGRPRIVLRYGRSPGDSLLCTGVLRELRERGAPGLWMQTDFPDLFERNPDVDAVVPYGPMVRRVARLLGGRVVYPEYGTRDPETDRSTPSDRHLIAAMCRRLGIAGGVSLRPYVYLTPEETAAGRLVEGQIAIQSTGLGARLPMRNKEWGVERFQEVVSRSRGDHRFVQIGAPSDPPLVGALDARGGAFRRMAAILSASSCFVGLAGFPMHLARAVDCRAVIVYGGREASWQSGYSANENLCTDLPCAPCWLWNRCEHDRRCLTAVQPDPVVAAIARQLARVGEPLPTDTDTLDA